MATVPKKIVSLFVNKKTMGLIVLQSSNPKFSHLIHKNPERGLIVKPNRNGHFYCFYPMTTEGTSRVDRYVIYFRDGFTAASYKSNPDSKFEYMDILRYTSPEIPLNALRECLRSSYTKQHEDDLPGFAHIFTSTVKVDAKPGQMAKFTRHFPKFEVAMDPLVANVNRITIKSGETLHRLLNFVNVLFTYIAVLNKDHYALQESQLENQLRSINLLEADYFIRYLLSSKMITSEKLFQRFKPDLECHPKQVIDMQYGNTAEQRRNYIRRLLSFNMDVVDVGCGEGFYAIPFAKKLKRIAPLKSYYALDTDESCIGNLKHKKERSELDNLQLFTSLDDMLARLNECEGPLDVIITEVVEHMDRRSGQVMIARILKETKWQKVVITTPNYGFNQFYLMDSPYRHTDHVWEATQDEFREYVSVIMDEVKPTRGYDVQYLDIGDRVNGLSVTQGVLISARPGPT